LGFLIKEVITVMIDIFENQCNVLDLDNKFDYTRLAVCYELANSIKEYIKEKMKEDRKAWVKKARIMYVPVSFDEVIENVKYQSDDLDIGNTETVVGIVKTVFDDSKYFVFLRIFKVINSEEYKYFKEKFMKE